MSPELNRPWRFALDASLALAWCFEDEKTKFTEAVLQALPSVGAAVPSLWVYEVANGLRTAQRHQRVAEVAVMGFVERLGPLPIDTFFLDAESTLVEVRLLALSHNLTVYDASYLALAERLRVPLGTLDGSGKRSGIKQAARERGVELLSEGHLEAWVERLRKENA